MAPAHETVIRAVGMTLASLSMGFALYMLAYGGGKIRVNGMDHLAIFAQPRGPGNAARDPAASPADPSNAVDMSATGSLAASADRSPQDAHPIKIVAAQADRVWLKIGDDIRAASPGDSVQGLGRIGAIVARDDGWAVVDDKGKNLLTVSRSANGASLFARRKIFE